MLALDPNYSSANANYLALADTIVIGDLTATVPVAAEPNRPIQRRKYCRYSRTDIQTYIAEPRFPFRRKLTPVRLIDVSQAGLAIGYGKKMRRGQHLHLVLEFQDGRSFEFNCVTAHRRPGAEGMIYGLKFEKSNRHFEEHLLKTGLKIKLSSFPRTE